MTPFRIRITFARTATLLLPFLLAVAPAPSPAMDPMVESMAEPRASAGRMSLERIAPSNAYRTGICADLERGHTGFARLALDGGAKIDAPDPDDPWHRPPLFCAAESGRAESVELLLSRGAKVDVTRRGLSGPETPLSAAAGNGHADVVRLLLKAGASTETKGDGWTPLMHAAYESDKRHADGFLAALTALLDAKADLNATGDRGETALSLAIASRNPAGAVLLTRRGADPNRRDGGGRTPLSLAVELDPEDGTPIVEALLAAAAMPDAPDRDGKTPWVRSAERANRGAMDRLFRAGAKERYDALDAQEAFRNAAWKGDVPLMKRLLGTKTGDVARGKRFEKAIGAAARGGSPKAVRFLLENGADPNAPSDDGSPPLVDALSDFSSTGRDAAPRAEIVSLLLDRGADPNVPDARGGTALLAAVTWDNPGAVQLLLARKADPNQADADRTTPLHKAVAKGDRESAKALLAANADPAAKDRYGKSPWSIAAEKGDREAVDLLEKAGAAPEYALVRWEGNESRIETLWKGAVTTNAEWADLWRRAFGTEAPKVDFTKYFVACAFLGHRAGWWYSIGFGEPVVRDGKLIVDFTLAMRQVSAPPAAFLEPRSGGQYAMRIYPRIEGLQIVVRGRSPESHFPGLDE